jgi:hypothetical protein
MKQRWHIEPNCNRVLLEEKPESTAIIDSHGAVMTKQLATLQNFWIR